MAFFCSGLSVGGSDVVSLFWLTGTEDPFLDWWVNVRLPRAK